ncbi:hypothetical protein [Streptomyces xantholiticus]|uniref:hypothetical protein n=1 Tax=Streptomyces xantholiticus TaxID=68285 RepID=UPI0016722B7C|nr:hypothetical protein [Streptomyces xantholiticus]GGW56763.1 hypothetical protein GCM10010381_47730 [Streptomyces xantholiticus]
MEIKLEEVVDEPLQCVVFTCPLGAAWGVWRGREVPGVGSCAVEFDIPGEVGVWSKAEGPATISGEYQEGLVLVRGQLESVDEDGVAGLRLGSDVILVDVPSGAEEFPVGGTVEFTIGQIDIYPYVV